MKIIIQFISAFILIGMISCKGNNDFILSGKLQNKKEKNIYVIFDDPIGKIDTVKVIDGNFEYQFSPDTITMLRLLNDSGIAIPLFADRGWEVNINGSFSNPQITGNGSNKDYQDFKRLIKDIKDSTERHNTVKSFIMNHRQSYACAYIINEYII